MKTYFRRAVPGSLVLAIAALMIVYGQEPKADEQMNKRGDHVMGFDHTRTTHHFLLQESGGSIEVTATAPTMSRVVSRSECT